MVEGETPFGRLTSAIGQPTKQCGCQQKIKRIGILHVFAGEDASLARHPGR
jgi:hypothetical protein